MLIYWIMLILAVPDLTEPQLNQLATARDGVATWDEPALYPLLNNVLSWGDDDASDAATPDYDLLHRSPADYRGQLFLIKGPLGGPPQPVRQRLLRPGLWENNLQQWGVLVHRSPDDLAIVLLTDPMPLDQLPKRGGPRVRLIARFFKVWQFVDRQGQPTEYLLFVGKHVKVDPAGQSSATQTPPVGGGRWIAMVVLIMAMGWLFLRRKVQTRQRGKRPGRAALSRQVPLPQDPADALAALDQDTDDSSD